MPRLRTLETAYRFAGEWVNGAGAIDEQPFGGGFGSAHGWRGCQLQAKRKTDQQ